jgi:phosphoglycerol transferase
MLTVDTHTKDGYLDETCELKFNSKYANVLYCADQKINSFINWIKEQDFYDNTTIIITGDHLTMQLDFYDESYNNRTIYNTIINSKIKPKKEKNRLFSTLDMFPTTLASLGVEIEGNRLGLGVNLFSKEKTILEELGFKYINNELTKTSIYYNKKIIK